MKRIKKEFNVPRTPQQNGIAERKNRTLIEAARTMLADSLLPIPFWDEAVNTACFVQNRVLVTKPQNKTPYELLHGRTPSIGFMRPFGCLVTILNTLDPLDSDPTWLFDIDTLTKTMNYQQVTAGNQSNPSACVQEQFDTKKEKEGNVQQYVLFHVWSSGSTNPQNTDRDVAFKVKELEFEGRKPQSKVYVSLSSKLEDITYSDDEEYVEPKRVHQALKDPSLIEAMQEELLQFKMHKVWVLVDLPHGKGAICTKWVFRNKKDERGIVVRNKDRFVAQGHTQEEGIDYEEVFAPVARIEAIRLFLAYASFIGFMVDQLDVKSAFLYGTIEEEVYVCQPLGFEDPDFPNKVYKVVKALYGLHQAPGAWYETLANYLLENDLCKDFEKLMKDKFQMSSIGELTFFLGLQVKQKKDEIFISQDKYVAEILRKFSLTDEKSASTPINTEKPLLKVFDGEDVDVHTYRSMIGSLMYLTSSRLGIMFAACAYARFQVTPKASHLHAVKRIFRYLKGKPHLGLWYPKDSPFNLVAYSNSDYAGASLDRKFTTGGCHIPGCRLISWQCKKQTVVATSSTEAEYVAVASCYAQVL
nr:putative ribonuclease H-like domain-containing protein [Tanacetum cinerariifolium]